MPLKSFQGVRGRVNLDHVQYPLVESSKTGHVSCSVRVVINMASTTLTAIFGTPSAVQPVPQIAVSETKDINQNQSVDLTAFILSGTASRK